MSAGTTLVILAERTGAGTVLVPTALMTDRSKKARPGRCPWTLPRASP